MASKIPAAESGLRIVLMGKTGSGRSTAGNTILRVIGSGSGDLFTVDKSAASSSVTSECSAKTGKFNGQVLTVVDTPGLFHTQIDQVKIMVEILDLIELAVSGPLVFLWMVNLKCFDDEDEKSMEIYKKLFPSAGPLTIVLFTRGDKGEVQTLINDNPELKKFIKWSKDQSHVFDNTLRGDKDQGQVEDLVKKINEIQPKKGSYHSDLKRQADKAIEAIEELKKQLQEKPEGVTRGKEDREKELIDVVIKILGDQCPVLKAFLDILPKVAEKMIKI